MFKIRAKYFLKRFSLYFIYGAIASLVPFLHLSLMFGFPAVLLCAISLALADCLNIKEADNIPKVFTKIHTLGIFVFIMTVVLMFPLFLYNFLNN